MTKKGSERAERAFQLREAGALYREIGAALGVGSCRARQLVFKAARARGFRYGVFIAMDEERRRKEKARRGGLKGGLLTAGD